MSSSNLGRNSCPWMLLLQASCALAFALNAYASPPPQPARSVQSAQQIRGAQQVAVDLRNVPVPAPAPETGQTALNYHKIPIDLRSRASREPLVDVSRYGIAANCYYARDNNPPYFHRFASASPIVRVREGVARKLMAANQILRPYGVELLVLDGYRSIELQKELWNYFVDEAKRTMKDKTQNEWIAFAGKFCSDPRKFQPDDWQTWPTHNTGGAVDVTLREIGSQRELNMGGAFDDPSDVSSTNYYEGVNQAPSQLEACRNRRLLYGALTSVGFANYPSEWWHFDYLTQFWVQNGGKGTHALYGSAEASR